MASRIDAFKQWIKRSSVHPDARKPRKFDGISNEFLGYGTSRDKLSFGTFVSGVRLTDVELHAMYYSDDVSAKVVNLLPDEMLRAGYHLVAEDRGDADALQKRAAELNLDEKILRAYQWGRLYGGALLIFGAIDGGADLAQPLNPKTSVDVRFLNVVDRRNASVLQWQDNPFKPNYGEPEVYLIGSTQSGQIPIHCSRVIRFDGVPETDPQTRRELAGWTYSVLQRPYDVVRKFATCYDSLAHLMADASQGVWKIQGLIDLLANNREELLTRMQFADMTRSAGRAVMVDAEGEDFDRKATPLTGAGDIIDRWTQRLSTACDYPVALLMGQSAAGLNATGDSDFRAWYGRVKSRQTNELKPQIIRAHEIIGGNRLPAAMDVEFNPLWEPTKQEQAATDMTVATTRKLYVDMGAITPEHVAIADFGDGNGKITIDQKAIEKSLAQEISLMGMGDTGDTDNTGDTTAVPASEVAATAPSGGDAADGLNGSKVVLAPTDAASVVTVNEARAAMGLGKLTLQGGAVDPDGFLTVAEFKAKRQAAVDAAATEDLGPTAPTPPPNVEPDAAAKPTSK